MSCDVISRPSLSKHGRWTEALALYIQTCEQQPFAYGLHDCCCFVAGAIHAMTGYDMMARFRHRYESVETIEQVVAEENASCLTALIRRELQAYGWRLKSPSFATRGDVVLLKEGAMGIVSMDARQVLALKPDQGICLVPLDDIHFVWGID